MHTACNHGPTVAHACICKNEAKEGFGCSSSVPRDLFMKTSVVDDIHRDTSVTPFGSVCHDDGSNKEYRKSRSSRNHGQGFLHNPDPVSNSNACLFPSGQPRFPEVPTKVGFLSSNMNSARETPSFEFFVMSEEGINLYVDLKSSPSEWITTLKDEVFIEHNSNAGSVSDRSRCVSDTSQHTNPLPSKNIQMNLQINKVGENSGCTNSSLSSVVSANCQDEVYPMEAKVASSGSYILTSSSNPAHISGCLERSQAVSSPCIAPFQENISILENCVDVSVRTVQTNVSVRDVLTKSNGEDAMHAGVASNIDRIECRSLKLRNAGYDNADNSALSNCTENNLIKPVESIGNTELADVSITENHIDMDVMKFERDCRSDTNEGSSHHEPSNSCQFCGQSNMNTGESLCCHQACNYGNSVGQDIASASDDNLRGLLMKENLGCLPNLNALNKVSKRPCTPEFKDTNKNKRLNYVSRKVNETQRSTKVSLRENVDDLVLPRRSSRLHSK